MSDGIGAPLAGLRLLVVTGKGGSGRSTVAAGLSRSIAGSGGRVLAVDAVGDGGLARALAATEVVPGQPTEVGPPEARLHLLELSTEVALDEYVRLNLRIPIPTRSLGPLSRIFEFVANAAPAVTEILTIGKIGWEVRERRWDTVVVDGPASGHVVELLAAPTSLRELVAIGPLADDSAWLEELLADAAVTGVVVVTAPEELVVTETLELVERLRTRTVSPLRALVVNRVPVLVSPAGRAEALALTGRRSPLAPAVEVAAARAGRAEAQLERLRDLTLPTVVAGDEPADPVAEVLAAVAPLVTAP